MTHSSLVARFTTLTPPDADREAIHDDVERVSFAELGLRARRVAAGLVERGLSGQRVALLATQGSLWVEAFFGGALAGATLVPLSHLHPEQEQRWFVETSQSRAVLSDAPFMHSAARYSELCPALAIEELLAHEPIAEPVVSSDNDTALILYTSGTTGKPKGALISHENLAATARLLASAWRWSESDKLLHSLPLHHLHGLGIALFTSLLSGGSTRMLARFDAARLWDEMGEASVLMGVPTMHKKLLDAFDAADAELCGRWRENARQLRLVTSGSAALPLTIGERWRELTGDYPLERFGMTEIGVGMSNPLDGERRPGSCGLALPGMQIRIVDESGNDVAPGESGEIWIRGPSVIAAYDANAAATREAFQDGWFKSGDTATWLEGGYGKILGRTSVDILKSGGYKLSALEIEEVLRDHPAVADVAVVGVPDETWGEIAVAALILRPGAQLSEPQLRAWAKQRVAAYKVPKRVLVMDDFPRNPVGKVVKPELGRVCRARL